MNFPLRHGHTWFNLYNWFQFPNPSDPENAKILQMLPQENDPILRLPYLSTKNSISPVMSNDACCHCFFYLQFTTQ